MDKTIGMALLGGLHLICCGLLLLLLSDGSLAFPMPSWPVAIGIIAALGVIGLGWHLRRRSCASCPLPSPRGSA